MSGVLKSALKYFWIFVFGISSLATFSQTPAKPDSSEIQIKSADYLEIIQTKNVSINRLVNNVILVQKDLVLYCDSALLFKSSNIARAYGHVHLVQADSIHAFADSAYYDGNSKTAKLFSDVKLTDNSTTLTTNNLSYDLTTKIATYV
ncbi:MAG: OstA-like protein, partial [Chitinophagales bacterium]